MELIVQVCDNCDKGPGVKGLFLGVKKHHRCGGMLRVYLVNLPDSLNPAETKPDAPG